MPRCDSSRGHEIPWVFPGPNGLRLTWYYDAWRVACRNAGLEGKLIDDLRRTAVRNLERTGVPRSVAMKLTGHKTESVYRRYAIVSETDLVEAVARVAKLHGPMRDSSQTGALGDTRNRVRLSRISDKLASLTIANSNRVVGWLQEVDSLRRAIGTAA